MSVLFQYRACGTYLTYDTAAYRHLAGLNICFVTRTATVFPLKVYDRGRQYCGAVFLAIMLHEPEGSPA